MLEAEFFTREPVRRALAGYDFEYVFRAIRRTAGLIQEEPGDLLDLDRIPASNAIDGGSVISRSLAVLPPG